MAFGLDPAHRADQPRPVEVSRDVGHDHLAVAHDDDAVAGRQHLAQDMRDQDAAHAGLDRAAHMGQELPGRMRVKRGGRLVENDEPRGRVRDREGARDLDHLLAADGQVLNQIARPHAVARERSRRACRE